MRVKRSTEVVYSQPTMCLHCHLLVELFHERDADPASGAWKCPRCGHKYPFAYWKIRKQTREKPRVEHRIPQ